MTEQVDAILTFWFGAESDPEYGQYQKRWFVADPAFDEQIRQRFLETHEAARAERLDHWRDDARSVLALVLVLDQFSRNLYRDSPDAFAADAQARSIASEALARGRDQQLPAFQRWFLYMPFMHSEYMADQDRSVELFRAAGDAAATSLPYAVDHREMIRRFGRFPHRNAALGRTSTDQEIAFLEERR